MTPEIKEALFIQQRIQILHLGKNFNEFSDAYVFAWESGVYPLFEDGDGSLRNKPHEIYEEFFTVRRSSVQKIMNRLGDAMGNKEQLTFYALESELGISSVSSGEIDRSDLIDICRYFYLNRRFNKELWSSLLEAGQHPGEAGYITGDLNRESDLCFM